MKFLLVRAELCFAPRRWSGLLLCSLLWPALPASGQTDLAVVVRHAPSINSGRIEGSLWQLTGEDVTLNGGAQVTGDMFVPGTPTLQLNGQPNFGGAVAGTGGAQPSN